VAKRIGLQNDILGDRLKKVVEPKGVGAILPTAEEIKKRDEEKVLEKKEKKQEPINQSVNKLINKPINQLIKQSIDSGRKILKGFYITEKQDRALSDFVNHLQKEYKIKVDKSAVLRAILDEVMVVLKDKDKQEGIINRLINQAINKLVNP
jgi:hypothetical protein